MGTGILGRHRVVGHHPDLRLIPNLAHQAAFVKPCGTRSGTVAPDACSEYTWAETTAECTRKGQGDVTELTDGRPPLAYMEFRGGGNGSRGGDGQAAVV